MSISSKIYLNKSYFKGWIYNLSATALRQPN